MGTAKLSAHLSFPSGALNAVADSVRLAAGYRFGTRAQHAVAIVRM
jgi:hypothetical protein